MPIDFPNSPTNGQTYTDGGVTWTYSSTNKSWTMTTFGDPGVSNGTDLDNTIVTLNHVGGAGLRNLPVAATGMKYDPAVRTFSITMTSGQTANVVELKNNAGTTLNSFNARGILEKAGRIYYSGTAPTVDAADTGQLWCNISSNNALNVWDGSAWVGVNQTVGAVDTNSNQVLTGTKTFSSSSGNGIELAGTTACIAGSGPSKAIVFKPTNASSVAAETCKLTSTAALFASGIELDFYVLGAHALGVVCSLATAQTITGLKTFTANIQMGGSDNKIFANDSTTGNVGLEDLSLCANLATNSRYIKIDGNFKDGGSNGITINAKNSDGNGKLTVLGDQSVQGSLSITGSLSATSGIYAQSTVFCSVSGGAGGANNISYPLVGSKYILGPLEIYVSGINIVVSNTKPTPVRFFYKIEQGSVFAIQLCTIGASATNVNLAVNANTQPATPTLVGASTGTINVSTSTIPAIATITLVN